MCLAHGLVAQLGAHHIRIVGVEGSNPFKSTKQETPPIGWCFLFIKLWTGIPAIWGFGGY